MTIAQLAVGRESASRRTSERQEDANGNLGGQDEEVVDRNSAGHVIGEVKEGGLSQEVRGRRRQKVIAAPSCMES